jgi:hypothetical protein
MPTFVDGNFVHQADLNSLSWGVNDLSLLLTGVPAPRSYIPTATAKLTSTRTLTTGQDTTITFDSAAINNDVIWVAAQSAFVLQTGGVYVAWAQGAFTANATGIRSVSILLNGTAVPSNSVAIGGEKAISGTDITTISAETPPMALAPGAALYYNAFQSSGGNLTLQTGLGGSFMCVMRLGNQQ